MCIFVSNMCVFLIIADQKASDYMGGFLFSNVFGEKCVFKVRVCLIVNVNGTPSLL